MFVVEDKLISDELLDAPFTCHLAACRGACCVQGESGAPLEPDERALLETLLFEVAPYLNPEALAVIDEKGVWEEIEPETYAIPCTDDGACVFVTYDGLVAKCAIQQAYLDGRIAFPKPISCHLFPVRVERIGTYEVLNYEQVSFCNTARIAGRRQGIYLLEMLRDALVRKYGAVWYDALCQAGIDRARQLNRSSATYRNTQDHAQP